MAKAFTVKALVRQVRAALRRKARPAVARESRRFFKPGEGIATRGVRARDIQRIAARARQRLRREGGRHDLLRFGDALFASRWFEERAAAIYVVAGLVSRLGPEGFRASERWLRHVADWATCDGLSTAVLGPQLVADSKHLGRVFRWARSRNRWYRRAAAASLIPAARRGIYVREVLRLARRLYRDPDEMVEKGVGWLLKEASKTERRAVVKFLLAAKRDAPRLVLRYACEKLPPRERRRVLG